MPKDSNKLNAKYRSIMELKNQYLQRKGDKFEDALILTKDDKEKKEHKSIFKQKMNKKFAEQDEDISIAIPKNKFNLDHLREI